MIFLGLVVVGAHILQCAAWLNEGHMMVAAVAWEHLKSDVQHSIVELLRVEGTAGPDGRYVPPLNAERSGYVTSMEMEGSMLAYVELRNVTLEPHMENIGPCKLASAEWPFRPLEEEKEGEGGDEGVIAREHWDKCADDCAEQCNQHDECGFFEHNPWRRGCHCRLFHRYCVKASHPGERGCKSEEEVRCSRFFEKLRYPPADYTSDFVTASEWADEIRRQDSIRLKAPGSPTYMGMHFDHSHWKKWHYTRFPFEWKGAYCDGSVDTNPEKGPSSVWAVERLLATLGDPKAARWAKALALRMFIHIIGDMHQPLHSITRCSVDHPKGDDGGKNFALQGDYANLHDLWDNMGGLLGSLHQCHLDRDFWDACYVNGKQRVEMVKTLAREWMDAPAEDLFTEVAKSMNMREVGQSMNKIAEKAYEGVTEHSTPSQEYVNMVREDSRKYLLLGGYRLAHLLNLNLVQGQGERYQDGKNDGNEPGSEDKGLECKTDDWWLGYVACVLAGLGLGHLATRCGPQLITRSNRLHNSSDFGSDFSTEMVRRQTSGGGRRYTARS
eukprot:6373488-Amphidinium_carterae.1